MVCHCRGVNDRRIRREIAEGADTVEQIAVRCGAGSRCGGCVETVREVLVQARPDAADRVAASAA